MRELFLLIVAIITGSLGIIGAQKTDKSISITGSGNSKLIILKDVGEAYMDHFGLADSDFSAIKAAGVDIIEGNFDICASDEDVEYFLSSAAKNGLQVIMPAGSGEAEWGYECDKEDYSPSQAPVWQKEAVVDWVNKWKGNEAIYAWDISNEVGSVFPIASKLNDENSVIPDRYYIDANQLKQAYSDVKSADPTRPIMIRMNGWFFYDYDSDFFRAGNPFGVNTADIVMVNAYSNVEDYYPDFVPTVTSRVISSTHAIDPKVKIIVSLGAWRESPLWYLPEVQHLQKEIDYLRAQDIIGIAYFKYGAKGSEWYLPSSSEGSSEIWNAIKENSK